MKLVVDTNVVLAGLARDGATRAILLDPRYEFVTPEYTLEEARQHVSAIARRARLDPAIVEALLDSLLSRLRVVKRHGYERWKLAAREIVAPFDPDDWPFVALALAEDCPLWTSDKALLLQDRVPTVTTEELLRHARERLR